MFPVSFMRNLADVSDKFDSCDISYMTVNFIELNFILVNMDST